LRLQQLPQQVLYFAAGWWRCCIPRALGAFPIPTAAGPTISSFCSACSAPLPPSASACSARRLLRLCLLRRPRPLTAPLRLLSRPAPSPSTSAGGGRLAARPLAPPLSTVEDEGRWAARLDLEQECGRSRPVPRHAMCDGTGPPPAKGLQIRLGFQYIFWLFFINFCSYAKF
jgi:hypothetical protein